MKAAWDWHLPRETVEEQRAVVEFAADCGFDTLVIDRPTAAMRDAGDDRDVDLIEIVRPEPDDEFCAAHPGALQRMLAAEEEAAATLAATPEGYNQLAHRWFPLFRRKEIYCFEHPAARDALKERVSEALDRADGVAFDGFGYRNGYACFCERCRGRRAAASEEGDEPREAVLARTAEDALVEASELLYDHAKGVDPDCTVTNHVWPPFRPNPYYGHRLRLDYCSQTISWFYRPNWSTERVAFEAAEHARLEEPDRNTFVPFVGLYDDEYQRRSADRVRDELEIAFEHGDGDLVFCTLAAPSADPEIRAALRDALDA